MTGPEDERYTDDLSESEHYEVVRISVSDYEWAVAAAKLRGESVQEWIEDVIRTSLGSV